MLRSNGFVTAPAGTIAILAGAALCAVVACGPEPRPARGQGPRPSGFAADPLWDDGRAEIDAYDAAEIRYGVPRPFTAHHIIVKEDLSRRQLVKADPGHDPSDLMPVLKFNQVIVLQTGIYSYHQMASTFHDRATMDLVKFSLASFEWCGNSYKEFTRRGDDGVFHVHTYWDGQAEATYRLAAGPDLVFYDQLPLWIRSLPQSPGTRREVRLVPTQIFSQGPAPAAQPATLAAVDEGPLEVPAGKFATLRWEVRHGDGALDVFHLDRRFPFVMVGWDKADGGRYRLRWTQRLAYWTLHDPGGERSLEGPAGAGGAPPPHAGPARP